MAKRTTTKATQDTFVIKDKAEFLASLDKVATLGVELDKLTAEKEKAMQVLLLKHDPSITAKEKEIEKLTKGCELFASTRREELFGQAKKSAKTALTTYGYRLGQPKLACLKGWTFDKVVAYIKDTRRKAYLVTKVTLDKDAIRQHVKPGKLAKIGLEIKQDETFFVERNTEE